MPLAGDAEEVSPARCNQLHCSNQRLERNVAHWPSHSITDVADVDSTKLAELKCINQFVLARYVVENIGDPTRGSGGSLRLPAPQFLKLFPA